MGGVVGAGEVGDAAGVVGGGAAAALDHQLDLGGDVEFGQQVDVVLQGEGA